MKYPIKSIFEQISERVFEMKKLDEAKLFIVDFVSNKDINEEDKQKIIVAVNGCKYLYQVQMYICNSLLKYEGLGMNNFDKTAKQAAAETAFE
jgi:hypothetical protein